MFVNPWMPKSLPIPMFIPLPLQLPCSSWLLWYFGSILNERKGMGFWSAWVDLSVMVGQWRCVGLRKDIFCCISLCCAQSISAQLCSLDGWMGECQHFGLGLQSTNIQTQKHTKVSHTHTHRHPRLTDDLSKLSSFELCLFSLTAASAQFPFYSLSFSSLSHRTYFPWS